MLFNTGNAEQEMSQAASGGYLGVQRLLDAYPPLDSSLSSLNLGHDLLNVLQLVAALPEHRWNKRHKPTLGQSSNTTSISTTIPIMLNIQAGQLPEYSITSSGVLPSTSRAMFSMSSLPHFSLALMNWLKSRLFQMVKP